MALTFNIDFKCNQAICFGVGDIHNQFKIMQATINRFATLGQGFAPIAIDGFIGDQTLTAANAAAAIAAIPSPGSTKQELATNALAFTAQLQAMLQDLEIVGAIAPVGDFHLAPPPPEIDAAVQQAASACRRDRQDPACVKAKLLCRQVKGASAAKIPEIAAICSSTVRNYNKLTWAIFGGLAVVAIGAVLRLRKR